MAQGVKVQVIPATYIERLTWRQASIITVHQNRWGQCPEGHLREVEVRTSSSKLSWYPHTHARSPAYLHTYVYTQHSHTFIRMYTHIKSKQRNSCLKRPKNVEGDGKVQSLSCKCALLQSGHRNECRHSHAIMHYAAKCAPA